VLLLSPAVSVSSWQAVNVGSTVVAILLVDRLGRRFLFIEGGIQMILCEVRNPRRKRSKITLFGL
jgi:hypothetical protein